MASRFSIRRRRQRPRLLQPRVCAEWCLDDNILGGGKADITYTTESTDNNLAFSWQWSAAAYTYWPDNNGADILPYHGGGLHASTPLNPQVQQS
jgi:hypothetical protein